MVKLLLCGWNNMIYGQLKNGKIENAIVIDDESIVDLFKEGFDDCVRIDNLDPQPGKDWTYNKDEDGVYHFQEFVRE